MAYQRMSLYKQVNPRVNRQVVIKKTRLGHYLLSGNSILEIDDLGEEIVRQCDKCQPVEEIAEWISEGEGELTDVYGELNQFSTTPTKIKSRRAHHGHTCN